MSQTTLFLILEWPDNQPPFRRYSLATRTHAAELESYVRCVQTCPSLDTAAFVVAQLNAEYLATVEPNNEVSLQEKAG